MNSEKSILFKILSINSEYFGGNQFKVTIRLGQQQQNYDFKGQTNLVQNERKNFEFSDHLQLKIFEDDKDEKVGFFRLPLEKLWKHDNRSHVVNLKCTWIDSANNETLDEGVSADVRVSINFPHKPLPQNLARFVSSSQKNVYDIAYENATNAESREEFWREQAKFVEWFKFPKTILDSSNKPFYRWFPDGLMNINYNMIDRYLPKYADKQSLIWVSNMVQQERTWSLHEVYENVCKMALLLKKHGVQKGDRVIIYFPMIPEALFATWACARIGAIHSIVFGGFAAKELGGRIRDATPKVIVTTSCGLEPNKTVNYVQILKEALEVSGENPDVLIYQRPSREIECSPDWNSFEIDKLEFKHVECEHMHSTDMLYILYTSGTTGQPKGIVRDHGGTAVALEWMMKHTMDIHLGDVYFAASDIGWVVGHNYTVYGPLLRGATTVLYEGKPMLPHPGVLWEIVQKYKVKGLYTSPTGLRAIRKEDNNGDWVDKYDISTLNAVSMAGERCDIPTYEWIQAKLKVLINDNYWQTECGWGIACNYKNLFTFAVKPGSATKPCPGFQVEILNADNEKMPRKSLGKVCIKLPMPPSFMLTLYNNDKAFIEKYMDDAPGYYTTGDAGYFDEDGYLNVMTRLDDIINTAGHRLSTANMEEELMTHPKVSEAAVVAKIEQLKGEVPIGFVVLKSGCSSDGMQKELVALIRKQIGPVASFQIVLIVEKLPKTRSGKILRHILRKIIEGETYKYPATIEDDSVLKIIEEQVKSFGKGLGEKKKLLYRGDVDLQAGEFSDLQDEYAEKSDK